MYKTLGLQHNGRQREEDRACACQTYGLAENLIAERFRLEYSGPNVSSKELQRSSYLFFARFLSEDSQVKCVNDFGFNKRRQ